MRDPSSGFIPHPSALSSIAIIGAGQIGSRHLQGLAQHQDWQPIHLVDPSEESLRVAAERFAQASPDVTDDDLRLWTRCDQLPSQLDLAIVATSADVRAGVIKTLLQNVDVKALILEKVLFQSLPEYDEIEELLANRAVPCWVNFGYRAASFYQQLKHELANAWPLDILVRFPVSWGGFVSSGIHFLDLLAFFAGDPALHFEEVALDERILNSKRKGCKDFTGRITVRSSRDDRMRIETIEDPASPCLFEVRSQAQYWRILDPFEQVHCTVRGHGEERVLQDVIPFQSGRTGQLAVRLLKDGRCALPTYAESQVLHRAFICVLLDHYRCVSGEETNVCPIT